MKFFWILAVSLALAACTADPSAPAFEDLTNEELQTRMGRLALQVDELEGLLSDAERAGPDARKRIVAVLEQMSRQASELPVTTLEHPKHKSFASRLRQDIDVALHAVRGGKPDYEPARLITSSCTYCHERRSYQQVTRLYEQLR